MAQPQPIASLGPNAMLVSPVTMHSPVHLLLCFVIVTLIAWALFYWLKPTIVQKTNVQGQPTGVADAGKSFLAGLLVGLLVTLLYWLLKACR